MSNSNPYSNQKNDLYSLQEGLNSNIINQQLPFNSNFQTNQFGINNNQPQVQPSKGNNSTSGDFIDYFS